MGEKTDRRRFLGKSATGLGAWSLLAHPSAADATRPRERSFQDYLRAGAVDKRTIDTFLQKDTWAQFDSELGYIVGNYMPRDGIDQSATIVTSQADGTRRSHLYSDRPCRINTYGNSFTACNQVSDGETWQEYLAAHLGEPIRNFGVGGYGVYQSYRRMLREEAKEHGAKYVILYMWGDDYFRSLLRCRYMLFYPFWNNLDGGMFHNNFWANLELDLDTGVFVERDNILSTPADLYRMTDGDFLIDALNDDLMLQMSLFVAERVDSGFNEEALQRLSHLHRLPPIDFGDMAEARLLVDRLRHRYAFSATKWILDRAAAFAKVEGKELLVVHFDPFGVTRSLIKSGMRYDQEVVDHLRANEFNFFDMNEVHVADFKNFKLSFDDYMERYLIGHYSPIGNHFFAFSIKDRIVDWLDPKPITYRQDERRWIDFEGYLPG